MQRLILGTLDELKIYEEPADHLVVDDIDAYEGAAMAYAEELNPVYQLFAKRVSSGIRSRTDSTGI